VYDAPDADKRIFLFITSMKRILIVDDEPDLCEILSFNLQTEGYHTNIAYSAEEAISIMKDEPFDLLLLDVMMDGMSGFQLARQLKRSIPIIFLTAKNTEEDMLIGFQAGADDYITKPFSVREVLARIKAVLNRTSKSDTLQYGDLIIDLNSKTVSVDGRDTPCTRTELELLSLLLSHRGQVFSRQQLLSRIWPKDVVVSDRTVDVNITRLRKKLGRYASNIVTRQGYGYCFED